MPDDHKREQKPVYSFRLDPELRHLLRTLKERDGIPESEQIRRALKAWFEQKGLLAKPKRSAR